MATWNVPNFLGGEPVLGKTMHQGGALAELVRRGLPAEALFQLARRLDLGQAEMAAKIGIPLRTLSRRLAQTRRSPKAHQPASPNRLTAAESDRTVRLAQVFALASETLGSEEKAAQWLKTPNRVLRGGRPLDQLDTDPGVREVEDVLGRISYGIYS